MNRALSLALPALVCGCYHFTFDQEPPMTPSASPAGSVATAPPPAPKKVVTYEERVGTYLNGFIGNGRVETARYCERPVRTELRVTAIDVLFGVGTLLIYVPHTLYVTCAA
jgi:hypothetical protein